MNISLVMADYANTKQAQDIIALLNSYACHPMGGGEELSVYTQNNLIPSLSKVPGAFSILCYDNNKAIGLANCLMGFSSFKCAPLINIHDLYVSDNYQGQHIGQQLLQQVENVANERECCKITLEVLQGNHVAQGAYKKFGFSAYELDPSSGTALFWEKTLEKQSI